MRTVLSGCTIVGEGSPTTLIFEDGLIVATGEEDPEADRLDLEGLTVAPGLIDIQVNGAYGEDFTSNPTSIWRVGELLPRHGVTAFLPTIVTSDVETTEAARAALRTRPPGYRGAEPLGLHLEGPMLNPDRAGVHQVALMQAATMALVESWSREGGVALVTIAPELAGAGAVVKQLLANEVVVSAGHSAADYDQAQTAFAWGVSGVTHLFNAMPPMHHRAPGLAGAALDDATVTIAMILDGIHVHPALVSLVWRLVGSGRLVVVSDAVAPAGLGPGSYRVGPVAVEVDGDRCTDARGRLAGSTVLLDQAVRNLIQFSGCPPEEALASGSSTPARLLGVTDRGRLALGSRADLALFDDDLQVKASIIGGEVVFKT